MRVSVAVNVKKEWPDTLSEAFAKLTPIFLGVVHRFSTGQNPNKASR